MNHEKMARKILAERSNGVCEVCGRARATDAMHRLARSHGGPWCPSNLLAGCRSCHEFQRAPGMAADARFAGHVLITGQDPLKVPAWTALHGWVMLREDGTFVLTQGCSQGRAS